MRNYENSFDGKTNDGNTGWESLADDDFERRRIERANRRYEKMQRSEAIATMKKKAMTLAAAAILTITVIGGVAAGGCSTHEIMDTERAKEVETIYVESVTLMDGPNIRRDPVVSSDGGGSNVIMDFGEEGQRAEIPYQGEAYYYHNEYDPNGGWYGFPAEKFADELFKDAFIDGEEVERLAKKDDDNIVWINDKYVGVDKTESVQN